MPKIVIADTSCFIVLQKLDLLTLLKQLYSEVITTPEVAEEYGEALPSWVLIQSSGNQFIKEYESILDPGEASAMALAQTIPDSILILDDLQARKVAQKLALNFTGTLGLLAKAKTSGLIPSIKPVLLKLKSIKFRISPEVEEDILNQCNEK